MALVVKLTGKRRTAYPFAPFEVTGTWDELTGNLDGHETADTATGSLPGTASVLDSARLSPASRVAQPFLPLLTQLMRAELQRGRRCSGAMNYCLRRGDLSHHCIHRRSAPRTTARM
jgi:hypothetical protein